MIEKLRENGESMLSEMSIENISFLVCDEREKGSNI